jgi:hypothetical protein
VRPSWWSSLPRPRLVEHEGIIFAKDVGRNAREMYSKQSACRRSTQTKLVNLDRLDRLFPAQGVPGPAERHSWLTGRRRGCWRCARRGPVRARRRTRGAPCRPTAQRRSRSSHTRERRRRRPLVRFVLLPLLNLGLRAWRGAHVREIEPEEEGAERQIERGGDLTRADLRVGSDYARLTA